MIPVAKALDRLLPFHCSSSSSPQKPTTMPSPSPSIHQERLPLVDYFHNLSFSALPFVPKPPSPLLAFSPSLHRTKYRRPKASVSSSLGGRTLRSLWNEFNRFVQTHCERTPLSLGFASVGISPSSSGEGGDGIAAEDGELPIGGLASKLAKKVLILMSDTGGGHRASAEAIKAAFNQEFGDEYLVFVTDLWTDHTPWPFNQLPRSYNFLVKYGTLWKMTYYGSAPRLVHQPHFAATSAFIAREVAKGLMKYQPDIIISVHPLMQHVPLRILRAKGLLKKIVFTTVVTDLSTCHPTWFHKLVTRCYCPSSEVAKRALKAGLQPSQRKVYGLPVRPSFVKPVRCKDFLRRELGMDEDLPAVLLMGGGEGMGPIEATARALGKALYDDILGEPVGQILVICGHNRKLANRLRSIDWKIPVQERFADREIVYNTAATSSSGGTFETKAGCDQSSSF